MKGLEESAASAVSWVFHSIVIIIAFSEAEPPPQNLNEALPTRSQPLPGSDVEWHGWGVVPTCIGIED